MFKNIFKNKIKNKEAQIGIAIYWSAVKWRFIHRGDLEIIYFASDAYLIFWPILGDFVDFSLKV